MLSRIFPQNGPDPAMLWYPSAGNDYRDLLYLSEPSAQNLGIDQIPVVHLHTDYDSTYVRLDQDVVYRDERTCITIKARHRLELNHPVRYEVSPEFAVFTENAHPRPVIWLLDVEVRSASLGTYRKPVIWFFFENINFLSELLLAFGVKISHVVKVMEGFGLGGNRRCISVMYPFFKRLGVKYALLDDEVHFHKRLFSGLARRHRHPEHPRFMLRERAKIADWSGFSVKVFAVKAPARGTAPDLNDLLYTIGGEHTDYCS